MFFVALKMLTGDRAKFFGIIFGITFASMLITQQASIFVGIMTRTFGFLTDTNQPDLWVMDPKVQFVDDIKPMQDTMLLRVRGVEGVRWAMPLYKGLIQARMENGTFQTCNVVGLDDATLIGGPGEMVEGSLEDLRLADSVIVDQVGAATRRRRHDNAHRFDRIVLRLHCGCGQHRGADRAKCQTQQILFAHGLYLYVENPSFVLPHCLRADDRNR